MRFALIGNSGSGKSTLAAWLCVQTGGSCLDLDTIAWEPGKIAVPRRHEDAVADLIAFCDTPKPWVVEGCYADLIGETLRFNPTLVFLNPGSDQCVANCLARPWEPHKYPSKAEQDERLAFLLDWVRDYYSRDGTMSLGAHRALFDRYPGRKLEFGAQTAIFPPSDETRRILLDTVDS